MNLKEEMLLLMKEFESSGLTQKEFSASKDLGFHKFNYWYRKLKREKQASPGFVLVDTGSRVASIVGDPLEVVYPNGVKLKVACGDLSLLSRLIRLY